MYNKSSSISSEERMFDFEEGEKGMDEDRLRVIEKVVSLNEDQLKEVIDRIFQLQLEGYLPPFEVVLHSTGISTERASA